MASGKEPRKFGGVKAASRGTSSASSSPKQKGRTFGVVKAPQRGDDIIEPLAQVRAALRRHTAQVERVVQDILREEEPPARYPSVLWSNEYEAQDWNCPYHCTPVKLASGWSHAQDCEHWTLCERQAIQLEGAAGGPGDSGGTPSGATDAEEGDDLPF